MQRMLRTKRLYFLGDYRNIEFEDIFEQVPAELMLNGKIVSEIQYLQLIGVELAYRRYVNLIQRYPHGMAAEEAIKALEEEREATLGLIKDTINGNQQEA